MVEEASDKFLPVVPFLEEVNPVWLNSDTFLLHPNFVQWINPIISLVDGD
ncbi:hypothetical protein SAMN05421863_100260 [Nitrosomonas communis]|uniref:Uncharacterized protein n=2 Tax=Nitrosomonas communis TaxID=44574 RepID=A0A1I4JHF2_9PROT|nr:hypothetical protein SAMN05421863_100260 [Nitrosomonas communis]